MATIDHELMCIHANGGCLEERQGKALEDEEQDWTASQAVQLINAENYGWCKDCTVAEVAVIGGAVTDVKALDG